GREPLRWWLRRAGISGCSVAHRQGPECRPGKPAGRRGGSKKRTCGLLNGCYAGCSLVTLIRCEWLRRFSMRLIAAERVPSEVLGYTRESLGDPMYASVQLLSASRQNLRLLTLIRVLVLGAQAGAVGLASATQLVALPWLHLGVTLAVSGLICRALALPLRLVAWPWLLLGVTLAVSGLICLATAARLRGPWPVTEQEYAFHLATDLLIHSALLYYSGGSAIPFVSYYLVPWAIAAA